MDKNSVIDRILIGMIGLFGSMLFIMLRGPIGIGDSDYFLFNLVVNLFLPLVSYVIFAVSFFVLFKEFIGLCKEFWKDQMKNRVKKQGEKQNE